MYRLAISSTSRMCPVHTDPGSVQCVSAAGGRFAMTS